MHGSAHGGRAFLGAGSLDSAASDAAGADIESFEEYVAARRERDGRNGWRSDRTDEASISSGELKLQSPELWALRLMASILRVLYAGPALLAGAVARRTTPTRPAPAAVWKCRQSFITQALNLHLLLRPRP